MDKHILLEAEKCLEAVEMRLIAMKALRDTGEGLPEEINRIREMFSSLEPEASETELEQASSGIDRAGEIYRDVVDRLVNRRLNFPEIEEADKQIEENPSILEYIPEEAVSAAAGKDINASVLANVVGDTIDAVANFERAATDRLKNILLDLSEMTDKFRQAMLDATGELAKSEYWQKMRALFDTDEELSDLEAVREFIHYADIIEFEALIEHFEQLYELAETVIAEMRAGGREHIELKEFYYTEDPETGEKCASIYERCIELWKANQPVEEQAEAEAVIEKVTARRVDNFIMPIDILNKRIWKLPEKYIGQELKIDARSNEDKKSGKKEINLYCSVNLDNLGLDIKCSTPLTIYGKTVQEACYSVYAAGNTITTYTQIWKAMGNTGSPSPAQIEKLANEMGRQRVSIVFLDNEEEASAYNYPHFEYDGSMLPFERVEATINGKTTTAIHFFRSPPPIEFAVERGNYTSIPLKVLQVPRVSNTELNLSVRDLLLSRIAGLKNPKSPVNQRKILYESIFEDTNANTRKLQDTAVKTVRKYLAHYKKVGWIEDWQEVGNGVELKVKQEKQAELPGKKKTPTKKRKPQK